MAIRQIFTDDAPCLSKVAKPVEKFDDKLRQLLDDMADTMYNAQGVGLAAPQVGILRRIAVIDVGDGIVELINPKILSCSGTVGAIEGCLSYPGQSGYVERPQRIIVQAFDRHGVMKEYDAHNLFARAVAHETDHLDGKVFLSLVTEPPEGFQQYEAEE